MKGKASKNSCTKKGTLFCSFQNNWNNYINKNLKVSFDLISSVPCPSLIKATAKCSRFCLCHISHLIPFLPFLPLHVVQLMIVTFLVYINNLQINLGLPSLCNLSVLSQGCKESDMTKQLIYTHTNIPWHK